nr:MAG TPA: hypothetical protein [Caudoviricetes sp.]
MTLVTDKTFSVYNLTQCLSSDKFEFCPYLSVIIFGFFLVVLLFGQ